MKPWLCSKTTTKKSSLEIGPRILKIQDIPWEMITGASQGHTSFFLGGVEEKGGKVSS
jgi:hypothetical protein